MQAGKLIKVCLADVERGNISTRLSSKGRSCWSPCSSFVIPWHFVWEHFLYGTCRYDRDACVESVDSKLTKINRKCNAASQNMYRDFTITNVKELFWNRLWLFRKSFIVLSNVSKDFLCAIVYSSHTINLRCCKTFAIEEFFEMLQAWDSLL